MCAASPLQETRATATTSSMKESTFYLVDSTVHHDGAPQAVASAVLYRPAQTSTPLPLLAGNVRRVRRARLRVVSNATPLLVYDIRLPLLRMYSLQAGCLRESRLPSKHYSLLLPVLTLWLCWQHWSKDCGRSLSTDVAERSIPRPQVIKRRVTRWSPNLDRFPAPGQC